MDPQAFNSLLASYAPQHAQPQDPTMTPEQQAPAQPAQPHAAGNWFTHLLPTIGGVGGGILGAVFGGGVGGVGGAAGGSGLGKAIENSLEGKGVGDDVAKETIEGGAGQLVGGALGKGVGKAAELLGGAGTKIAGKTAAQEAIDSRALSLKDVTPNLQKEFKANDSLDHVKGLGFDDANPDDILHVANTSGDRLNDVLNRNLAASGPVDLAHYPQLIKDALAAKGGTLGAFDKVALSRGRMGYANTPASQLLQQLEDLGAGVAKTGSDPNELRTLTTKLGSMAADAKPIRNATTGAIDPKQKASYDVINEVLGKVKKALYDRPDLNDAIKAEVGNLTPEDVGSPQLAEHLNNVITGAGTKDKIGAQDLLDELSKNINISKLGNEMASVKQIGSSTGAQARAASDAGINNANTSQVLNAANHLQQGRGWVDTAIKGANHIAQNPAILSTLSRIGALGEKIAPSAGTAVATANGNLMANDGTVQGAMDMTPPQQQMQTDPMNSPTAGLSRDDLITLALYSPQAFSSLITPSAGQQQQVAAANTAETALGGLGPAPGGGIMSSLAGKFGLGPTGEYQRKAENAAQQIAAAMPGTDPHTVLRQLTDYTAGGASIDDAIQHLMANLHAVKQSNTNVPYQQLMNYQPTVMGAAMGT